MTPPPTPTPGRAPPILEIRGLRTHFVTYGGTVKALEGVDLTLRRGETLGLVGESGCGKSITALSVMRLVPSPPAVVPAGEILLHHKREDGTRETLDLLRLEEEEMRRLRGNAISMIFQEPMTSLNPVLRVGTQITESILRHQSLGIETTLLDRVLERAGLPTARVRERREKARGIAVDMLKAIGIADPEAMLERYPHELSGGMRQRVMIAMALACNPDLLIADEPTTALDVTIQAQIIELMKDLKTRVDASILLITHHLGVVAEMCDRVAVMYAGSVVETAPTREMFKNPRHPYTLGLLRSIPAVERGGDREALPTIPGSVPDLVHPPSGCRFHPRCPFAFERCSTERPMPIAVGEEHAVACHLYSPGATLPEALRGPPARPREAPPPGVG